MPLASQSCEADSVSKAMLIPYHTLKAMQGHHKLVYMMAWDSVGLQKADSGQITKEQRVVGSFLDV